MAALTSLLAAFACPQSFGRFGYEKKLDLVGLKVDATAISAKFPTAVPLLFAAPLAEWDVKDVSAERISVDVSDAPDCPKQLRASLWESGVRLTCPHGLRLVLPTSSNVYLTWAEGSTSDNIPTPASRWVLVSFDEFAPPYLIVLDSGVERSFSITGKAGKWALTTDKPIKGSVRIGLPLGASGLTTKNASSLGKLARVLSRDLSYWEAPAPEPVERTVEADSQGVEVTWSFEKPGVLVPTSIYLAPLGGYAAKIASPIHKLSAMTEEGPLVVCDDAVLKCRFPIRRVPTGRFLAPKDNSPIATASAFDVPTVANLALSNLSSSRESAIRALGDQTLSQFLQEQPYTIEPISGQNLPFGVGGQGADVVGAQAFLMQALKISHEASSEGNGLFTSLSWRRDFFSNRFWGAEPLLARRAEALAALTGALCPESERRLDGALFQVGLAAEKGRSVMRKRLGDIPEVEIFSEPALALRTPLFSLAKATSPLLGEIRAFGDTPVSASPTVEGLLEVQGSGVVTLAAPYAFELTPIGQAESFVAEDALGLKRIRFKLANSAVLQLQLKAPKFAKAAIGQPAPAYSD